MCRNIKVLFNFEPPATQAEIQSAASQFVRKISGSHKPSQANAMACEQATDEISKVVSDLLQALVTTAPPKNRQQESEKRRAGAAKRFA